MMTKKEMAECVLRKKLPDIGIPADTPFEELKAYVYTSSTIAVALETLGVITPENDPELYEYAQSRGGSMFILPSSKTNVNGDLAMLSVRELIDLLPDTREGN